MSNMTAYPGRTFGQLYHRFVKGNALATGRMEIGDRTIDLAAISVPTLVFAGNTDGIAPLAGRARRGAPADRLAAGALRGRARRPPRHAHRPGRPLDDVDRDRRVGGRVVARPAADGRRRAHGTIGSNPSRRYGSAGSRALGGR